MKALWSTSWPTRGGRTRKGQEGRGTEERGQWWWCGPMDPLGWGQGVVPEAGFQGFASRLELDWGASTIGPVRIHLARYWAIRTVYCCRAALVSSRWWQGKRERGGKKKQRDKMARGQEQGPRSRLEDSFSPLFGLSIVSLQLQRGTWSRSSSGLVVYRPNLYRMSL